MGPMATAPAVVQTVTPAAPGGNLHEALRLTQQNMQALQGLQEQTAELHRKFLDGQELAGRTLLSLIEQQRYFFQGGPAVQLPTSVGLTPASPELPRSIPVSIPSPAAAAPTIAPVPAPVAPAVPVQASMEVATVLLAVIAEKTGYPVEMLDLDMALDADLGIDSIKRVEILSALQERIPGAPVIRPEHLGSLQTLGQIVSHLGAGQLRRSHCPPLRPRRRRPG